MRIKAGHLGYCTNIHAGESWNQHFSALKENFAEIKRSLSPDSAMGIGLRLSHLASVELLEGNNLQEFKLWLSDNEAYVFTMNGFPYGGFHHTVVKEQVHAPDWTSSARLDYTLRLFDILSAILPEGIKGGISTSPLSYRHWFSSEAALNMAKQEATKNILKVVIRLCQIKQETGKSLHLDIEPEPDGILETGREFIDWFEEDLLSKGIPYLQEILGVPAVEAATHIREHINLCYDVCHFAIGYESHKDILEELNSKEIKTGKIQISAALKARFSQAGDSREAILAAFEKFNEPTYLHQVIARMDDGTLVRYPDLAQALASGDEAEEWRAHFHVPVFADDFGTLESTQTDITEVLNLYLACSFTEHLEVETYTWEVLPDSLKVPLAESITRELQWVKKILTK